MNPMSLAELKVAIAAFGGSTTLANHIRVEPSTVRAWQSGQNPVPMPTAFAIRHLYQYKDRLADGLRIGYTPIGGK